MIPTNSSLLVCVSIVFGCSLALGQDIQRLEPKPQGVKSVTNSTATSFPRQDEQDSEFQSRQKSQALQQLLSPSQRRTVTGIARKIAAGGQFSSVSTSWTNLVQDVSRRGAPVDVNSLARHVLSESYRITDENVSNYAEKLRMLQEAIAALQAQIRQLSYQLKELKSYLKQSTSERQRAEIGGKIQRTQAEINAAIEKLKDLENEIDMVRHQLQSAQQKQSQIMQAMSNVLKQFQDTASAIVRNLK
jgi:chromosome segregation ATPase